MTNKKSDIIQTGADHLIKIDERFKILFDRFGYPDIPGNNDHFNALARAIVFQQLNGNVARIIYSRVLTACNSKDKLSPEAVLKTPDEALRSAGLSAAKTSYVKALSSAEQEGGILPHKNPDELSNAEISENLTRIKGIGQWTADMFLIFTLVRPDILPLTDLGIKKGFAVFFGLRNLPSEKYMLRRSNKWRPYRSIASWYMWEIVDQKFEW